MSEMEERRRNRRIPVSIPAGIYLKDNPHEPIDGEILDISTGGAFVRCHTELDLGREVLLEIRFTQAVFLEGKVIDYDQQLWGKPPSETAQTSIIRWVRTSDQPGFGVEFVNLQEDKQRFLQRLVRYYDQLDRAAT